MAMKLELINTTESANSFYDPSVRNCYYTGEVKLNHFNEDYGFGYSMDNCLYEAALVSTLKNCNCVPFYGHKISLEESNMEKCQGISLLCAQNIIKKFGNAEYEDMVTIVGIDGVKIPCLSNCEQLKIQVTESVANFPNAKLFNQRPELCYVLKKVTRGK